MVYVKLYKSKNVLTVILFKILQQNRLIIYNFNEWNGEDDHVVQFPRWPFRVNYGHHDFMSGVPLK